VYNNVKVYVGAYLPARPCYKSRSYKTAITNVANKQGMTLAVEAQNCHIITLEGLMMQASIQKITLQKTGTRYPAKGSG
jgi:hypothetical protein